jgi:hypothetical protein
VNVVKLVDVVMDALVLRIVDVVTIVILVITAKNKRIL